MLTCRQVYDFLFAYVEGTLDAATLQLFERHLALCPSCVAYIAGYRETMRLARTNEPMLVSEEPPEELVAAILAAARRA